MLLSGFVKRKQNRDNCLFASITPVTYFEPIQACITNYNMKKHTMLYLNKMKTFQYDFRKNKPHLSPPPTSIKEDHFIFGSQKLTTYWLRNVKLYKNHVNI